MEESSITRRAVVKIGAASALGVSLPTLTTKAKAQQRPIRVGLTSIFSGRVAQVGISAKNALQLEIEAFNAAGGLAGRKIELIDRDSQGRPEEAARHARDLIVSEGCEILLCGEASGSSFAVHEVARNSKALCIHLISESNQLTADPKFRSWNTFRTARQAVHDSIAGGAFAAKIAREKGFSRWATIAADYPYGREATPEFMGYVLRDGVGVDMVAEAWPKLFQADYKEHISKLLKAKPQAMFCGLWGADLVAFIEQGNLVDLFDKVQVFSIHMADYTTLTSVKALPSAGVYSSNRYVSSFPTDPRNAVWSGAYVKRFNTYPTNWSWEAAAGARFLIEGMRKTGSAEPSKIAAAMRGMEIESPVGVKNGKILMRAEDQTIVNYAVGWGRIVPSHPFLVDVQPASWDRITLRETEWKRLRGYI